VSQNRHEILTFATFDKDYVEYVSGNLDAEVGSSKGSNSGPFLRMNEFGPFATTNKSHMKCLGYYVLAFTLQECAETDGRGVTKLRHINIVNHWLHQEISNKTIKLA
jgi:hypothetical protein